MVREGLAIAFQWGHGGMRGLMTLDAGLLATLFRLCRLPGDGSEATGYRLVTWLESKGVPSRLASARHVTNPSPIE